MAKTRRVLLASLMVALAVSLGYAMAGVPNVELITTTVFVSGYLLGPRLGAAVGAAAMSLHSAFNPLGAALPPLFIAQVTAFAFTGWVGGVLGPGLAGSPHRRAGRLLAALAGLLLTALYHLLTSVGAFLAFAADRSPVAFVKYFVVGMPFMVLHLVFNTGIFLVVVVPVLRVLAVYRAELGQDRFR